jgi:hypothetical protein
VPERGILLPRYHAEPLSVTDMKSLLLCILISSIMMASYRPPAAVLRRLIRR